MREKEITQQEEFEERIIEVNRVSRTVAGGRRIRFRVLVAVGNHNDKVGIGIAKADNVNTAVQKALRLARKNLIILKIKNETIPQPIVADYGASRLILKPGKRGAVIAGGALREILELTGIKNISAKIIGSTNKINVAQALINVLREMREI